MIRKRFTILWSILFGTTFVCCSLIILNALIQHKNGCNHQERYSRASRIQAEKLEDEKCKYACTTKECITISNYILSNMDLSTDPCEDFYDFACGNYAEKLNKGGNFSTIESLKDDLYRKLKDFIETSTEAGFHDSAAQKLKIVYESCMDTESSEITTVRFLQDFLSHIGIPNWPYLDSNFTFVRPTLEEALGKLASFEEYVFLRFYVSNVRSYVSLVLQEGNTDLYNFSVSPQIQTYHEDLQISKLKEIVIGILLHTGMDYEDINSTWEDFITVEKGIASIYKGYNESNITCEGDVEEFVYYSNDTQDESAKNMLLRVLESVVRNGKLTSRFSTEGILISCHYQHYMEKIFDVINTYNHRALAHYMALRVFINNLKYMNFPIRKNLIYAILEPYDRDDYILELDKWKFCISWLATHMKYALGLFYVPDMWPTKAVDELNDIFSEYQNATIMFVQNQDWIESKVKARLVQEVEEEENVINRVFGVYRNKTRINEYYEEFHPSRGSFISNVLNHKKFHFMATHLSPRDELIFQAISPFEATAWGGGNIYLSFGIMLPPFFNHEYPKLFNLAKLGQIIGHEIGHKVLNFFGMDNLTRLNLEEKQNCLIDQYFNFELKSLGKKLKGNYTLVENFPDNMAVKVTEKIAEHLLQDMTRNSFELPGLPFSPEELLYISFAQAWCEVRTIEKELAHYERDIHSSPEFRIKGGLQNSQRFSQVFNCPSTSFMNPTKKCLIFDD